MIILRRLALPAAKIIFLGIGAVPTRCAFVAWHTNGGSVDRGWTASTASEGTETATQIFSMVLMHEVTFSSQHYCCCQPVLKYLLRAPAVGYAPLEEIIDFVQSNRGRA